MLNSPCKKDMCSQAAKLSKRRVFRSSSSYIDKLLADDEDVEDSILTQIYEGRLNDYNNTENLETLAEEYKFLSSELLGSLSKHENIIYATFYDLLQDAS